jgi:hypothetical protein
MPKQTEPTTVGIHDTVNALFEDLGIASAERPAAAEIRAKLKPLARPRSLRKRAAITALHICAGELVRRAAPPELAPLRQALRKYATWLAKGNGAYSGAT